MKTQPIKTELGEFLALNFPKESSYKVVNNQLLYNLQNDFPDFYDITGYDVLGFADQVEVAKQVVKQVFDTPALFLDYLNPKSVPLASSVESLSSLLKSEGIFTENPYPNPNKPQPLCRDCADEDGQCPNRNDAYCEHSEAIKQYEQAQSNLWQKILLLKKIV